MGAFTAFENLRAKKRLLESALSGKQQGYSPQAPRPLERKEKKVPVRDPATGKTTWETRIVEE